MVVEGSPDEDLPILDPKILTILDRSNAQYIIGQRDRIKLSIRYAMKHSVVRGKVIDVGGSHTGDVFHAWQAAFPSSTILATNTNLHDPLPFASDSFDGCIAGEIFEHIGDKDFLSSVKNFSGVLNLLIEMLRVMKPGARCLLTTPNACSFKNIALAMCNSHPFMYTLHYREYAKHEIEKLLTFAGARTIAFDTHDVFRQNDEFVAAIKEFCKRYQLPTNDRGNDFFLVFEKPADWIVPKIPENTAFVVYPNYRREEFTRPWSFSLSARDPGHV